MEAEFFDLSETTRASDEYYDPWDLMKFQEELAKIDSTELRQLGHENLEEEFYIRLVQRFVERGERPDVMTGDPIADYIISLMNDPILRALVLTDEVHARIFQDGVMRFVDTALKRKRFNINCRQSEMKQMGESLEWSIAMKEDGWQALVNTLDKTYGAYGFRSGFYRTQLQKNPVRDEIWESMYKDYQLVFKERLKQEQREFVESQSESARKRTLQLQHTVPEYMKRKGVSEDEFRQAWGMMGGEWDEYDFERYVKMARLQRDYPELIQMANRMGRIIDPDGEQAMWVGSGPTLPLEHSSKSDIQGVTMGRRLDALLPLEMAQLSDDSLDELFLQKFTTSTLQNFLHKSEQLQPNRRLERKRAKQKGPMIACIDTSGSMEGVPSRLARSFALRLVELARAQHRDLFLIAFSVSARPIDAKRDRVRLMDFFTHTATGDTRIDLAMRLVLELLEKKPEYMSADVVFIGDFRMPLTPQPTLDAILQHRQQGTFFYGIQIGMNPDNKWEPHFDHIARIGYQVPRRF